MVKFENKKEKIFISFDTFFLYKISVLFYLVFTLIRKIILLGIPFKSNKLHYDHRLKE